MRKEKEGKTKEMERIRKKENKEMGVRQTDCKGEKDTYEERGR